MENIKSTTLWEVGQDIYRRLILSWRVKIQGTWPDYQAVSEAIGQVLMLR